MKRNQGIRLFGGCAPFAAALLLLGCHKGTGAGDVEARAAAVAPPTIAQFLLYGERSITLGRDDHANGGDLGVRLRAPAAFGTQLKLGQTVLVDTHRTLFAPSVSLATGAAVGNVDADTLVNNGGTRGALAAFPAADMPPGPFAGAGTLGATNVTVAAGMNRTLDPGSYGALNDSGTVFLKPGTYSFASVTLADRAQLVANGGGVTTVLVAGQLSAGTHVTLSALAGGAGNLVVFVAGNDGAKKAVTIGTYASIVALVAAPHGTLSLGDHTDATGAYAGFDVAVGEAVVLTYQKGFSPPPANPPQQLSGYVTPEIAAAPIVGPVPQATVLHLAIGLELADRAGLVQKVHDVSDPTSSSYRHYLTPAQIAAAYGPSTASYTALQSWATAAGLTVTDTPANRLLLDVSGTAAQLEQALSASLVYRARPDGTSFFSVDREPAVTLAATSPIFRISGLDNRVLPIQFGSGPNGALISKDLRAAYASCTFSSGAGEQVGLFELDGFKASDITAFACRSGLVTCDPTNTTITSGTIPIVTPVLVDGYSGAAVSTGRQAEVTLDIAVAMSVAPGLTGISVFEGPADGSAATHNDVLNKMAADPSIRQLSSSWGPSVDGNSQTILYTMALQGQSFVQASGDTGSTSWSGSPPDTRGLEAVTVVGGTSLTLTQAGAYQSETTWNVGNSGSSGGGPTNLASPLYQAPFSNALGFIGKRLLPDIATVASGYYVLNGADISGSGTSASAPIFAAWVALANEQSQALGIGPAGFLNPFLYAVGGAAPSIYAASFNDIADNSTNGGSCTGTLNNGTCQGGSWVPSTPPANYNAVAGYDLATGLGSPKCYLMNELATTMIQAPPFDGGTDATTDASADAGADAGPVPIGPPTLAVVATEGFRGVEFCMQGDGYPEGSAVTFKFLNLPGGAVTQNGLEGPLLVNAGGTYLNLDSTFGGGASSISGFLNCSADDLTKSMTVQVQQMDDPTRVATASISNTWICGRQPAQNSQNLTPLPHPIVTTDTCPLPPQ
jgi:hypothetical protein